MNESKVKELRREQQAVQRSNHCHCHECHRPIYEGEPCQVLTLKMPVPRGPNQIAWADWNVVVCASCWANIQAEQKRASGRLVLPPGVVPVAQ